MRGRTCCRTVPSAMRGMAPSNIGGSAPPPRPPRCSVWGAGAPRTTPTGASAAPDAPLGGGGP
eukprot:4344243-Alexandrium_andersonii.AAC.1